MASQNINYRIFQHIHEVDISEQDILDYDAEVLNQLLIDHTMSARARREANDTSLRVNIFWATNDYDGAVTDENGQVVKDGFRYNDQIRPENITGRHSRVVMPRVLKDRQAQLGRTKDKAEVFTPSWVCNAQNNLIDEAWFGRKDVFNHEETMPDGTHTWTPTEGKIAFPEGDKQKTWKKYVTENRLEITCGEAPYLVSRYDTTTGEAIPLPRRIGLLDRKLRVVGENTDTTDDWLKWARKAYMSTYGYEWQGDNLLLAREALLYTFIEYYQAKFPDDVLKKSSLIGIARIISWNLWQMDGIKMVVPDSCDKQYETDLFGETKKRVCKACKDGTTTGHIGVHCLIRDWSKSKPKDGYEFKRGEDPKSSPWQKIEFQSLLHSRNQSEHEEEE